MLGPTLRDDITGISSITVSFCLCTATAWTSAFTAGSLSLRITILFLPISPRNSKMPWMTVLAKNSVSIAWSAQISSFSPRRTMNM